MFYSHIYFIKLKVNFEYCTSIAGNCCAENAWFACDQFILSTFGLSLVCICYFCSAAGLSLTGCCETVVFCVSFIVVILIIELNRVVNISRFPYSIQSFMLSAFNEDLISRNLRMVIFAIFPCDEESICRRCGYTSSIIHLLCPSLEFITGSVVFCSRLCRNINVLIHFKSRVIIISANVFDQPAEAVIEVDVCQLSFLYRRVYGLKCNCI